jgi:hypothetical protein
MVEAPAVVVEPDVRWPDELHHLLGELGAARGRVLDLEQLPGKP